MSYRLLALITSIALVGCAVTPAKLEVDNLAASEKTPVQDLRPPTEGTGDIFSFLITSDRYGYARSPLHLTNPSGPRLFTHRLQEKYGTGAVPPTKLHHFAVYVNNRAELKAVALGATFGAIGAVLANNMPKREGKVMHEVVDPARFAAESGEDEYKRAIYADPQNTASTSMFIVYIESELQQKRRFTRTVWPATAPKAGEKSPLQQAMDAAIEFNLSQ